jgi:hypothetical protein
VPRLEIELARIVKAVRAAFGCGGDPAPTIVAADPAPDARLIKAASGAGARVLRHPLAAIPAANAVRVHSHIVRANARDTKSLCLAESRIEEAEAGIVPGLRFPLTAALA